MPSNLVTSRTHSATLPSPDASPYNEDDRTGIPIPVSIPKGWCSERVPLSSYRNRRYVAASALMPFSSGRTMPSKWDDAERWISSPMSVGHVPTTSTSNYYATGVARASHLLHHHHSYNYSQRRTKSKSGPLGPGGLLSYGSLNSYSPVLSMGVLHGGNWRNSVAIDSPSALVSNHFDDDDGLAVNGGGGGSGGGRKSCPGHGGPDWLDLDLWSGPLSPSSKGMERKESMDTNDDDDDDNDDDAGVDRVISRRDMATQMFTGGGDHHDEMSSRSPSSAMSTPTSIISDPHSPRPILTSKATNGVVVDHSLDSQVRDVQVDKQISTISRSTIDRDKVNHNSAVLKTDKKNSKQQREEARIRAWENLQKAKAEAAIHKLEMELEKKRSSSMEKIVEKLKKAEIKAQKMRGSLSKGDDQTQSHDVARSTSKLPSFCRKIRLGSSKRHCYTCYPF